MFSTVIIARNEEKRIRQCIESALRISSDVIVVDSGSSDRTVELAKESGARVFEYGWYGYGANKNFGNEQAQNDWIISIDGDEIISPELARVLLGLNPEMGTVYQLNSMVNYGGTWIKHSGWYPQWKHRIFNKTECKWNDALVHEDLTPISNKKVKRLKGDLLHYSYETIEEHHQKINDYAELKANSWIDSGKNPSFMKRWLGGPFNFFKTFILKAGFLDGWAGWSIALMDARMARLQIHYFDELKKKQS